MRPSIYVDESKGRPFLLVAVIVAPQQRSLVTRALRALLMRGQRRVHMSKEQSQRRRQIVSTLLRLGVTCEIFESNSRSDLDARAQCLCQLAKRAVVLRARAIHIERDDSVVAFDREQLKSALSGTDIEYRHLRGREDPLLWIADAVAWCRQRGGNWRRQIQPIVSRVHTIDSHDSIAEPDDDRVA